MRMERSMISQCPHQLLETAKHNWIFSLDSDEKAGEDLVEAIRKVIVERGEQGPVHSG